MKAIVLDVAAVELVRYVLNLSKLYSYRREYAVLNTDMINTATETGSLIGELSHVDGDIKVEYAYAAIKGLNKVKLLISVFVEERLFSSSKAMPVIDFIDNIAASIKVILTQQRKKPVAPPMAAVPVAVRPQPQPRPQPRPQPQMVEVKRRDDDGLDDDFFG